MYELLTRYEETELRMIGLIEANSGKCGISNEIAEKIRSTHATTETLKGKACSRTQ